MGESETLSIEEAAALARVGVDTMKDMIDTGQIAAAVWNQKRTCLLREDVIDFIRMTGRKQAEERRKLRERKPRLGRTPKPSLEKYG